MRLDHVTLRVPALDDLRSFYSDGLGLTWKTENDGVALRYDDETVIRLVEAGAAQEREADEAGLFHVALRLESRQDLAAALRSLQDEGFELLGSADHLVSEALYLQDPAGNGIELYRDRPREDWERNADGTVKMANRLLDTEALLSDLRYDEEDGYNGLTLGHVHVEALDLATSLPFYRDVLDMSVQARMPGALFLAWNEYHHHIGLNTWNRRSTPKSHDALGLDGIHLDADDEEQEAVVERASDVGNVEEDGATLVLSDPNGVRFSIG